MAACIFILELIGTVAFAVSGAMTALKKNMDIFGVAILGLTTAVGAPRRYAACNFSRTGIRDRGDRHVHFCLYPVRPASADKKSGFIRTRHAHYGLARARNIHRRGHQRGLRHFGGFQSVFAAVCGYCHRRRRRCAARCSGWKHALYFCQARIRLRIGVRRASLRALLGTAWCSRRYAAGCSRRHCAALFGRTFPLEPAARGPAYGLIRLFSKAYTASLLPSNIYNCIP